MALDSVEVGRSYKMDDGRTLLITREWTAEDGHLRVAFDIVAGLHHGFLDDAKAVFQKNAAYEIISAGA